MSRFNILSLSGGGFFGLYTATVLADLEQKAGKPIGQCFDLIAGTSIGGIIALGIAAEKTADDIKKHIEKNGPYIFSNSPRANGNLLKLYKLARSSYWAKYRTTALRETVSDIFGATLQMADLKHRVLIPAVNLTKGAPQIFKTPHHPNFHMDSKLKVIEVALATSAAPTYFPLAEIGDSLYADGGLYANSPDLIALHEAECFLNQDMQDIHVLSIGTTTSQFSFSHNMNKNMGWRQWVDEDRLTNVIIASQQQSVDFMMKHKLNERYLRMDQIQSREQERDLALDVATASAQKTICGLADATIRAHINSSILKSFLGHSAHFPAFADIEA